MRTLVSERVKHYFKPSPVNIVFWLLFFLHSFFIFYGLETRHGFEWDQVDNAWAAKNILVDQNFPLVGMVAKQNSGFYIGPLYYYYVAPFYFLTNLDPIASVFIAGITGVITFFVFYFFIKRIFSEPVALVTLFIYTVSIYIISADRTQWPVNFLAPVSIIIFYFLYKIVSGSEKYILGLALALGLSWQLNFTAIFFFIIAFFALPFFPRTKKSLRYLLLSLPIIIVFFIPNVLYDILNTGTSSRHLNSYINEYYHGFHLTRVAQLAKDAFIEFAGIFDNFFIKQLRYLFIPLFFLIYLKGSLAGKRLLLCYLILLWFVIPWAVFSVYKGEITNYYFSLTRPITLMVLAFITVWIYKRKFLPAKIGVLFFWGFFSVINITQFFLPVHRPLSEHRKNVEGKLEAGSVIEFSPGNPESYLYYVYTRNSNAKVPTR